jgi:hypothetical protein
VVTVTQTSRVLDARGAVAWLRRFARTSPGLVVLSGVVVASSCLAAGLICGAALHSSVDQRRGVLDHSEPFAYAAQNLYAALSSADAAAATSFLSGGTQTPLMRARYQQALTAAASALADATAGAPDVATREALAAISARLVTYSGLVEAARANNVQRFPLGSAYLREASSVMQNDLLPAARSILSAGLARVDQAQRQVASPPIASVVSLTVALATIGACSVLMLTLTNRRFNIGLVGSGLLIVVVVVWIVAGTRLAADDINRARSEGTARFGDLAEARILAQQARTDEMLQIIARGDADVGEAAYARHIQSLHARLGGESPSTAAAVDRWVAAHGIQTDAYRAGEYQRAVDLAIGPDGGGSAPEFAIVESNLRSEMEAARVRQREGLSDAGRYLAGAPTTTVVAMVLAAAAAAFGLWPRLKEFL